MDFSEHYFTEYASDTGTGASTNRLLQDILGGDAVDDRERAPQYGSGSGADGSDGADGAEGKDGDQGEDGADGGRGADGEDGRPAPKQRIKKFGGKGEGSYGYMIRSADFYDMVQMNYKKGKYEKDLATKPITKRHPKMIGTEFILKPKDGEDATNPEKMRSVHIYKDKDKNPEWSAIVFDGKESFLDGFDVLFKQLVDAKDANKLARSVKWNQASPASITDPRVYGSWDWSEVPADDVEFIKDFISDMEKKVTPKDGQKRESISFSDYYVTEQETLYDYIVLTEEAIIDVNRSIGKLFKGIGGALKKPKTPKITKIKDPLKTQKYLPVSNIVEVSESTYIAINAAGEASYSQWLDVKEEYGVIAQQFVKMRNAYVKKIQEFIVVAPQATNVEEFSLQVDQLFKGFDLDGKTPVLRNVRVHFTTTGGFFSTAQITLGAPAQMQGNSMKGGANVEAMYFIGFDGGGDKYFSKRFGIGIKQYITQHANANPATIKKEITDGEHKHQKYIDAFGKTGMKFLVRKNVSNAELTKMKTDVETATGNTADAKKSGDKTQFTITTPDGKGKIVIQNTGKGKPGEIWLNPKGRDFVKRKGLDDITKYEEINKGK